MLNAHEIDLVASGWGTTGATLDGMILAGGPDIEVRGFRYGVPSMGFSHGYGGPETGNSYPGDPADLGAGSPGSDGPDVLGPGLEMARWLIDKTLELKKDWHAREARINSLFDQNKITITIDHKASSFNKALGFDRDWIIWKTSDGKIFADTNGNGAADIQYIKDSQGFWHMSDGEVMYRMRN
ncbi:hypothetical protein [Sphingomonas sp. IBVSS2]|uniref:hypothetical protein n=1 Tax=Sphingomonas sp. IBVSS2 TaxID=1985172 RepID=UPI0015C50915|nr:hypothetical protein [Sphingomonas sp. IBVSS2]